MTSKDLSKRREENLAAAAEINKRTDSLVIKSTVGIVASLHKNLSSLGSGTLLAVGDAFFVLSAGDVLREAKQRNATVGIGSGSSRFVATVRNWLISGGPEGTDEHDIALYRLTSEEASRLVGAEFVRIGDVSFDLDLSNSFFVVCGFPAMWSKAPSATGDDPMLTKLLIYGTTLYAKEARALQAIRATRWNSVTTLLHAAFPDLRPVLPMYIEMYGLR